MKFSTRSRVRIVIGALARNFSITRVLVAVAIVGIFAGVGCPLLNARIMWADAINPPVLIHALGYAVGNVDGQRFTTDFIYTNNTDEEIAIPFENPGCGNNCGPAFASKVPARSAIRVPYTTAGLGYLALTIDERLEVRSEITTQHGATIDVPPLSPGESFRLYDMTRPGPYNGGIFVAAVTDSEVSDGTHEFILRAGKAVILPALSSTVTIRNAFAFGGGGGIHPHGKLLVFGYTNNWLTGSLQFRRAY